MVSHNLWRTRYGADPGVVGTPVIVNGEAATIVGVMPEGFHFPQDQNIWVVRRDGRTTAAARNDNGGYDVVGRLKDGVSADQAQRDLALIADRLAAAYPETNKDITVRFRTFVEADTGPELVAVFGAMQVATIFVLLIAIANVSNLLLARATLRTREAAVRTALGASRLRIVLPFFAETLILSGAGALLGGIIAWLGVRAFDGATQEVGKPYYMVFALDFPILLFLAGITVVTALVAGAAPAFHVLRTEVNATLKDESRGASGILGIRLTRILVAAEIALSCALLIGAGLMIKSITRLRTFEYPYRTEQIFTARVGLFDSEYPTREARQRFFTDLRHRLAALPGVASAALANQTPENTDGAGIAIAGQTYATDTEYPIARTATISPGFFTTFGVALLRGRDFTEQDDQSTQPVAIVNESFAAEFFPGREALGQRFAERYNQDSLAPWKTIVGVVPDLKMDGFDPDRPEPRGYYVPVAQRDNRFLSMALHLPAGDPMAVAPAVRAAVQGLNPNLPIYNVDDMTGRVREATWFYFVFGTLFIAFGAAALFMATVGLYGVLSFSVSRRMREMGIRMALGAAPRDVIGLVVRQGGIQLAIGLGIGLLMAFGLTRVIGILMFEVTPSDPLVFSSVVGVIAAVGLLASLVPASKATRAEPVSALRSE
jgi:predicted permease